MKNFTFKKQIPTRNWRMFETEYHYIKLGKFQVGIISEASLHSKVEFSERFSIRFMIKDSNAGGGFSWILLKKKFSNAGDAKEFIKTHQEAIQSKYDLFLMEI